MKMGGRRVVLHSKQILFGILIFFVFPALAIAECPDGMISYWKFNETSPGSYEDFVGGNNGSCGNACPSPVTGKISGGQGFNGLTTGVNASGSDFNFNSTDSFSIAYWMKRPPVALNLNEVIVGRDDETDPTNDLQWFAGIDGNTGHAVFFLRATDNSGAPYNTNAVIGTTSVVNDQWHYVVAVRDGSDNILYVDGAEEGRKTVPYTAGFDSAAADLNIGWLNLSGGFYFGNGGILDEVAIYGRALTPAEIQAHYNGGIDPAPEYCCTANFSGLPTNVLVGNTVTFADLSTGTLTGWAWDFDNDGTIDSTDQNPTHVYSQAGTYTVSLTVSGPDPVNSCSETKTDYIVVTEAILPCTADFSASPRYIRPGETVTFTDLSTGTLTGWAWDFDNDGTIDSTDRNPTHVYSQAGIYPVSLTVSGPGSGNSCTETKTDYITVVSADFIPTVGQWGMLFLILTIGTISWLYLRRRENI